MDDAIAMAILSAIDLYARDYDYEYGLPHPLSQMIDIVKKAVTEGAKDTEQEEEMEELDKAVLLIKEIRTVLKSNMKDIERMNEFADRYGLHRFNLMEAETLDILDRTKEYEDRAIIQQQLQPDDSCEHSFSPVYQCVHCGKIGDSIA